MKLKTKHGISTIAFLGCFAAAGAGAQELAGSQNGVHFLTGGVGENSVTHMQARAKEFNLKLLFTLNEGNYLADVGVVIRDAGGKTLVEQVSNGPFFLATLPPGSYSVAATHNGTTHTRRISVGGKGQHSEHFRWPSTASDYPTLSEAKK